MEAGNSCSIFNFSCCILHFILHFTYSPHLRTVESSPGWNPGLKGRHIQFKVPSGRQYGRMMAGAR
jgi:hypothetical protein